MLDITPATLKRYLSGQSTPPRAMVRLLFLESYYGRHAITTHTANGLALERQLTQSLTATNERLRAAVASLEAENGALKQNRTSARDFAANSERWLA